MATTTNIGLYCFSTGEEDAKTSLEALFGAGNSNMKKIDDAVGELRKKSFIVNTEAELNALLTEENLGKTVSFNGELYIIAEGGGNAPIEVGETIDTLYFNTSVTPDLSALTFGEGFFSSEALLMNFDNDDEQFICVVDLSQDGGAGYGIFVSDGDNFGFVYGTEATQIEFDGDPMSISQGWQNLTDGVWSLGVSKTITAVNQDTLWSSYISKEPFGGGGGIIAKPVGAEGGLPSFAPEDAGKFLRVDSNGNIVAEAIAYAEGESF